VGYTILYSRIGVALRSAKCFTVAVKPPEHLVFTDQCAYYRPVGQMTLMKAGLMLAEAIGCASAEHAQRLCISLLEVQGLESPSILERYSFARKFARAAKPGLRVAVVCPSHWILADKWGVVVARTHGLHSNVFDNEEDAVAWLMR
jgi:hypothetical protein